MKVEIKYAGIDLHQSTCLIEVQGSAGEALSQSVVKTEGETLRSFFRGIGGTIHVAFEVGTQSAWLYEMLKGAVTSITVCDVRKHKKRGNKSDRIDAHKLATWLRLGELEKVYQGDRNTRRLRDLAHAYLATVSDSVRVMNRIKALYRSWAIKGIRRFRIFALTWKRYQLALQCHKKKSLEESGDKHRSKNIFPLQDYCGRTPIRPFLKRFDTRGGR